MNLAEFVKRLNGNQKHTLVDKAIDFIRENYHVANLSLQTMAEEVQVSSAYPSSLFKVEKGFNFGDYLLETRMKKAMELFQKTDLKTYEVAEMVGYSNPQYFSSSFKKYTGYPSVVFKKSEIDILLRIGIIIDSVNKRICNKNGRKSIQV